MLRFCFIEGHSCQSHFINELAGLLVSWCADEPAGVAAGAGEEGFGAVVGLADFFVHLALAEWTAAR